MTICSSGSSSVSYGTSRNARHARAATPRRVRAAVPAGTKLLSFVVVARLSKHPDPLDAVDRLVELCTRRRLGGERGPAKYYFLYKMREKC